MALSADQSKPPKPIDRWLGLAGIAVGIALYLLPKTPGVVIVSLALMLALLLHPIWKFYWIEDRRWRQATACILLVLGLTVLGVKSWPDNPDDRVAVALTTFKAQLDEVVKNTKQQPKIEVNLPPAPPRAAYVSYQSPEASHFSFGNPIFVSLGFKTSGEAPMEFHGGYSDVVFGLDAKETTQRQVVEQFKTHMRKLRSSGSTSQTITPGESRILPTQGGPTPTADDVDSLLLGKKIIFVLGYVEFTDPRGRHIMPNCSFLQPPMSSPPKPSDAMVWHYCGEFNKEYSTPTSQ
jgi:hypothetical protein